jgi:hypothetical protein
MVGKRDPFPVLPGNRPQVCPGNVKDRTFRPNGMDAMTGPDYANRRGNTDVRGVQGTVKPVRRFGVAANNRGEWKR